MVQDWRREHRSAIPLTNSQRVNISFLMPRPLPRSCYPNTAYFCISKFHWILFFLSLVGWVWPIEGWPRRRRGRSCVLRARPCWMIHFLGQGWGRRGSLTCSSLARVAGWRRSWARRCGPPGGPSSRGAPGSWRTSAGSSGPCMGRMESSEGRNKHEVKSQIS